MLLRELLIERIAILKNLSERSVVMYLQSLDRFAEFLGHDPTVDDLEDLTAARFLRWRAATRNKNFRMVTPASLAKDSAHLRSIWSWLAKKRWKRSDGQLIEFPDYANPVVPRPRPRAYRAEELARLVEFARRRKGSVCGVPAAWFWPTLLQAQFQTGERIGAILQIRWREADTSRHNLTFLAETRKGRRETITRPITPELSRAMESQRRRPDELVWPWIEDRQPTSLYNSLRVLCRVAGVEYRPFHSIRKATASYIKAAGKSARTQLGHASETMAERHYYDTSITGSESHLGDLPDIG